MTAAATTGPNSDPRPTSSTPAMYVAPAAHARFSNFSVQRSFLSRRNLAVEADTPVFDVDAGLDTEADQHLRPRSGVTQEQMFHDVWKRGFATPGRGKAPSPHKHRAGWKKRGLLLFDFFQPSGFALEAAQVVE